MSLREALAVRLQTVIQFDLENLEADPMRSNEIQGLWGCLAVSDSAVGFCNVLPICIELSRVESKHPTVVSQEAHLKLFKHSGRCSEPDDR